MKRGFGSASFFAYFAYPKNYPKKQNPSGKILQEKTAKKWQEKLFADTEHGVYVKIRCRIQTQHPAGMTAEINAI
jgi:hypothetical protein